MTFLRAPFTYNVFIKNVQHIINRLTFFLIKKLKNVAQPKYINGWKEILTLINYDENLLLHIHLLNNNSKFYEGKGYIQMRIVKD